MIFNFRKWMFHSKLFFTAFAIGCLCSLFSCSNKHISNQNETCTNYPDWHTSQYILPYMVGETYTVIQGNCEPSEYPWTHYDKLKFAYDFGMPIGTNIIAARSGTVVFVRDQFTDNDHGKDQGNAIVLLQEDGKYALYAHITHKGSKVKVGQIVNQGEPIALSGNSGESPTPHLHFQVNECGDFIKCPSIPISFRNASPYTLRLDKGRDYTAVKEGINLKP